MTHEEIVAQLNELCPGPIIPPNTPWEQFKKLRSHLCETCNHAFGFYLEEAPSGGGLDLPLTCHGHINFRNPRRSDR